MSVRSRLLKARAVGWRHTLESARSRLLFRFGFVGERLGFQVVPVHYYSAIPSLAELRANPQWWTGRLDLAAVTFASDGQTELLERMRDVEDELPDYAEIERTNPGEGMGPVDAELLFRMVRSTKPSNVIEVGSGTSTVVIAEALRRNALDGHAGRLLSVEPYRGATLSNLVGGVPFELIESPVQDLALGVFERLGPGDVLFIDSTHVARVGSDVMYLVLQVLPRLATGVLVHIHDIPYPFGVLDPADVLEYHVFWNEWALVLAFLSHNRAYEVVICSRLLHTDSPEVLREVLTTYREDVAAPSSLWLRRTTA